MPPSPPMELSRGSSTVKGVNEEEPFLHSVKEENANSSDTSSSPPINLVANNDGEPPNEARFQKSVRNLDGLLIMSQLLAGSLLEKGTNFYEDSSAVDATLIEEEVLEKEQTNLVPLMNGGKLKPYQIKGVKWLISLWQNGLNGILADQTGLGKKIQAAGFLAHLKGNGLHGPYMIIGPLSTLSNWVNDISRFVPSMPVVIYHGDRVARSEIRRKFMPKTVAPDFPIIVTSYETAVSDAKILPPQKKDAKILAHYKWKYVVVDEGHPLKNLRCEVLKELKRLPMDNKLLLTAAPLENNLANLWSLLSFIWPDGYSPHVEFESWFDFSREGVEQHEETEDNVWRVLSVSKLHAILRPFLLRRTKGDIENMLPRKKEKQIQNDLVEKTFNNHLDEKSEGGSENGGEGSPNLPSAHFGQEGHKTKRQRTDDALLCLLGEISSSFQASLKSAETVQDPKATSPEEILETLKDIPDLARADLLTAYSILTRDHRRFKSLIALPVDMRKDWLLMEIENK